MIKECANCYPIMTKNRNVIYEKVENRFRINSQKLLRPIYLNCTSNEIIEYCDGKNTIVDITELMSNKYNESKDKIEQDILKILYPLWKLKIIMFKNGKTPFDYHLKKEFLYQNKKYEFAVIRDTNAVLDFIKDSREYYMNIHSYSLKSLSKKQISVRFMYSEEIFFSLTLNNTVIALISISPQYTVYPFYDCIYYNINNIVINEKFNLVVDDNVLNEFFKWCCLWFGQEVNTLKPKEFVNLYMILEASKYNLFLRTFDRKEWKIVGKIEEEYQGEEAYLLEHRIVIV